MSVQTSEREVMVEIFGNLGPPPCSESPILKASGPQFHPSYEYDDADLTLQSSDDVQFRVHSIVMKLFSSVIDHMLDVPRDLTSSSSPENDVVHLEELANVLCILLDNIYHRRDLPEDTDLPLLRSALVAADKYDMPHVLSFLCSRLVSSKKGLLLFIHPVQKYGVAWSLGFLHEAKLLSTETLCCDLNTEVVRGYLEEIDGKGVSKLQKLHWERKAIMLNALSTKANLPAPYKLTISDTQQWENYTSTAAAFGMPYDLLHHNSYPSDGYHWFVFMSDVGQMMEKCPDGSLFWRDDFEFFTQKKFSRLRELIDWKLLVREIRRILGCMPKAIDI